MKGRRNDERSAGVGNPLRGLYAILSVTYTEEGCLIWWNNRNMWLDGLRPAEMWADNDGTDRARVLAAVERLEGGFSG